MLQVRKLYREMRLTSSTETTGGWEGSEKCCEQRKRRNECEGEIGSKT